ncbi:hypothetical protein [Xanthomonas albilineans]|uniref:hypothetical protein n=1 Tax=Xanthomonas albilineans TaxID=29447 RepID=UPI000698FD43|nr:hypothetical protein [Xanthomonas albilineans]
MTVVFPSGGAAAPTALSAFLRGIERRVAVLAELQSGSLESGAPALAAAMRAFGRHAAALPMTDWPLHFWKLLAAVPMLRQATVTTGAAWPAPFEHLATLQPADRLALLLRIVAGLDEPLAAQVLQLSIADYQQALARACPRDDGGHPDAAAWRALAEAAQQHLLDLPSARLQMLAQLRDAAITETAPPVLVPSRAVSAPPVRRAGKRGASRARLAAAVIVVVAAALVGTLCWDHLPSRHAVAAVGDDPHQMLGDIGPVRVEALPPESDIATAPPLPVAAPASLPEPVVDDLDFYAWYAASAPSARIERSPPSAADLADAAAAAVVAPAVIAPSSTLSSALTPVQLHERQVAWQAFEPATQARLRQAATTFAALPVEQQHALRAQFAEMDALERRGWLLGPELGAEFWALQPLFGYVPGVQRQALLNLLRRMPAEQRTHLVLLSQRTPPQDRAVLLRDLLAQSTDSRDTWLRQHVAR